MKDNVLVTLKGKPIITQEDLDREKEYWSQDAQLQDLDEEPGTGYLGSPAFVENCLKSLIKDKIADEYILSNKINKTPAYQDRLQGLIQALHKRMLYDSIKVPIAESEIETEYAEHFRNRFPTETYKEDREKIKSYLRKMKFRDFLEEKIEQLKKEYDVKINEDLVK